MLNTLCINRGLEDAYLTDTVPSGAYEDSKNAVEERIKNYREIQISNSKKKNFLYIISPKHLTKQHMLE